MILHFIFLISLTGWAQDIESLLQELPFPSRIDMDQLQSKSVTQQRNNLQTTKQLEKVTVGLQGNYQQLGLAKGLGKNYEQVAAGVSIKHKSEMGKVLAQVIQVGSSSDKIFRDGRDNFINATTIYKPEEKWVYLLSYSNNRSFLNNVPLPGFIYLKDMERKKVSMYGFPFINIIRTSSNEAFGFRYTTFLPFNHRARIYFYGLKHVYLFLHYEQWVQNYFDSDRTERQERFFYTYKNASVGLEKSFGPIFKFDVQFGNGFDRKTFFSRRFSRERRSVQRFKDEIYGSLNLKLLF